MLYLNAQIKFDYFCTHDSLVPHELIYIKVIFEEVYTLIKLYHNFFSMKDCWIKLKYHIFLVFLKTDFT